VETTAKDNVTPLIEVVLSLFDPVVEAIDDPDGAAHLLKDLGYLPPVEVTIFGDFRTILGAVLDIVDQIEQALDTNTDPDYVTLTKDVIQALQGVIQLINNAGTLAQNNNFPASFMTDTSIVQHLPRQLMDYLIVKMLEKKFPVVHASLVLTGVIDQTYISVAPTASHTPYLKREIKWEKFGDLITRPIDHLKETYRWGTGDLAFTKLIQNLNRFGRSMRMHSEVGRPVPASLLAFNNGVDVTTEDNAEWLRVLKFPLLSYLSSAVGGEVYPVLNSTKDKVEGLGVGLYFNPGPGLTFPITDNITLKLNYTGTSQLDVGLVLKDGAPVTTVLNVFGNGTATTVDLSDFVPEFIYGNEYATTVIFDSSFGARLEFKSWAVRAGVKEDKAMFVETDIKALTLYIGGGKGDGFLQKILPEEPMKLSLDLSVGFSTSTGVYFKGSTAFEIRFPLHIPIGPISIDGLTMTIVPGQGQIPVALGADISAKIGPLAGVVQNMGVTATFSFPPDRNGNLGAVQMDLGFKLPSGIGLSLDTSMVKAGGFLSIKPDEYIGALELEIKSFQLAIKAIAIINTKLPGGEQGFSLLVIITAEFQPIQLGYGFSLNGLGGLFGYKRSFEAQELRAGLKTGALDSILFPKNVIANITHIVDDLKRVFPMGNNFLIGPMVKIGWGTSLITAEIGILVQVPDPVIIAILGIIKLALPDPDDPVVLLQINFLGVIDFEKKMLSLDASLSDSRVLTFTITGDFAVRLGWGSPALFIFSSGGFHPDFKEAPVELQHMDRLGIQIINEEDLKLGAGTYLALTTNTVQIGAAVKFWAKSGDYTALAEVGFDALIQFDPFFFSVAVYLTGRVTGPMVDVVIDVRGNLAGPNPWHLWGHAHAKVAFFEITIPFDKTFGDPIEELAAGLQNVLALLQGEVPKDSNWRAITVIDGSSKVSLRNVTPDAGNMVVHPNTKLSFNQRVVPLEVAIQNFGQQGIDGANMFSLSASILAANAPALVENILYDSFAPGNFFDIKQDQKLSRPSFEQMKSGKELSLGVSMAGTATPVEKDVDYEVIYIRKKKKANEGAISILSGKQVMLLASGGAAAKSKLSVENNRVSYQAPPKITINKPGYNVVNKSDLSVAKQGNVATPTYDNQTEAYNKQSELDENETLILSTQEL